MANGRQPIKPTSSEILQQLKGESRLIYWPPSIRFAPVEHSCTSWELRPHDNDSGAIHEGDAAGGRYSLPDTVERPGRH